ncbi:hypothetical protein [Streptomyces lateritius]|uniref:hypothetical protein n=1 Tax=Streptomyces lateritius TaxID=67313 RepID=UPI0016771660|nr:hypothetical protein [Streptomyces lateritius]
MSEWGIALIAAGSAILGSITTGFFALKAGHRQAEGAEKAGLAQANALIATVQATLDEQRRARADDRRRQVYAELLTAGSEWQDSREADSGTRMVSAFGLVELEGPLEGPSDVVMAALRYLDAVRQYARSAGNPEVVVTTRTAYISAVRRALAEDAT